MSEIGRNNKLSRDNLNWQAFLYVAGEMTDVEAAAFECQLNPDSDDWNSAACEAVAGTVQLSDDLVRALDTAPVSTNVVSQSASQSHTLTRRDRFARWASLAAPVIAIVGLGWMFAGLRPGTVVDVADQAPDSAVFNDSDSTGMAGEMVRLWVESEISLNPHDDEPHLLAAADVPDTLVADVPDWLLAAVQSQQQAADGLLKPEVLEN